jgi:hypothetical protein
MHHDRASLIVATIASAVLVAGCGNNSSTTAPSATTSAGAPPAPASTAGATIAGTVVGSSGANAAAIRTLATSLTVSVTGTSMVATIDSGGHFTFTNVPSGHVDLHFVGPGVDAHLGLDNVADHSSITISVRVSGSQAELDNDDRNEADNTMEIEGLVTAVGAGTLTVSGKTIVVPASTVIVHGGTTLALSDIKMGDRVHVKATTSGTPPVITATKIEVQQGAATPGKGGDDDNNEASGKISAKAGVCPALTFSVGSTPVATNSSTKFEGVSCATLANGTKVDVSGVRQASGVLLASKVEADD